MRKRISIVVPCYNEAQVIVATNSTLLGKMRELLEYEFEIIYVNDGSSDNTYDLLVQLHSADPSSVKVISLSRNFGHQTALSAGVEYSEGDAIVMIDADLQDPPRVIGDFLKKWEEGYDVVYGVRMKRKGESLFKQLTAKMFYRLIDRLSETHIPLDSGDFRLLDRRVANILVAMSEHHRFLRGMISWVGLRQTAVYYDREARQAGESKYPLRKMMKFAVDGILSFSSFPLRVSFVMGVTSLLLSGAGIVYALFVRLFTGAWVSGWTSLAIMVLLFGGIQLFSIGTIGEYIGRIFIESKNRPLYIVDRVHGFRLTDSRMSEKAGWHDSRSFS